MKERSVSNLGKEDGHVCQKCVEYVPFEGNFFILLDKKKVGGDFEIRNTWSNRIAAGYGSPSPPDIFSKKIGHVE